MSIVSVRNDTLGKVSVINAFAPLAPVITGYNILISGVIADDTAVDTAGGQTIQVNGTGFISGAVITLGGSGVTTAYVNANTLTFTAPIKTAATYAIYVLNPDGGTAIFIPGVVYSGTPAWTTTAISPASVYETNSITTTALVTTGGDGSIVYSLASGTLPAGATLDAGTGVITGTAPAVGSNTTYTFTIKATDQQLQDSTSTSFSLTINTDVVTWSSPAAASTITLPQNAASTTALVASSAAGKAITYTSTALPAGLSISGATVTGTPTAVATTAVTFTATAADTSRTATAVINWTISVAADTYFRNTTLLLSGAAATETFVADASVNNFPLTIAGDTKPSNFNPYTPGYYSNYFAANQQLTSTTIGTSIGTSDFSMECWVYVPVAANSYASAIQLNVSTGYNLYIQTHSSTLRVLDYNNPAGSNFQLTGGTINSNTWYHLLLTRQSGTVRGFIDGKLTVNQTAVTFNYGTAGTCQINAGLLAANISNARVILGNVPAAYQTSSTTNGTQIFTPSTLPLTAVSGTALLTCQSNRFLDNSTNAFTLTKAGSPQIQSFTPFVPNTAYATQGSTYFDGTGYELNVPSPNQVVNFGTGDFTVEFWIYLTSVPVNTAGIISNMSNFYVNFRGSGIIALTDAATVYASTASALTAGSWFHIALVRSAGSSKIYTNGMGGTAVACTVNFTNTGLAYIGADGNGTVPGYISNMRTVKGVAVYTGTFTPPATPLSATQSAGTNIAAITGSATSLLTLQTNQPANNSMFLDSSTNAFAVTRAGNTSAGTFTPYGANWSNYFDGTGDYLSAVSNPAFALPGNFTYECWFNSDNTGTTSQWMEVPVNNGFSIYYSGTQIYVSAYAVSALIVYPYTMPVGTWNHLAVVRNGTGTNNLVLYINGVSVATATTNISFVQGAFRVGGSSYTFKGYISNARLVNGTAVYTTAFPTTVPTAPLTAIANTVLLTCQSSNLVDNSANAFALTRTGEVSVQRFSPFSPQTQTAITHSSYFDGTGDYLTVPTNAAFQLGTDSYTFEAWIYPTALGVTNTNNIINIGTYTTGLMIRVYGATTGFEIYTNNTQRLATSTGLTANSWQHIALVRNVSACTLYINGQINGTFTDTSSISPATATLIIGMAAHNSSEFFTGYMSNYRLVKGVAVYTAAFTVPTAPLTATQAAGTYITAITGSQTSLLTCQSPTFVDNSTNLFAITAFGEAKPRTLNPFGFTNASAAYSAAVYGGSAYFDGTTDYLTTPTNAAFGFGTGDFTCEAWIYIITTAADRGIFDFRNSGADENGTFFVNSANSKLAYWNGSLYGSSGTALALNTWYHVAFSRQSGTTRAYLNGVLDFSTATTFNFGTSKFLGIGGAVYSANLGGSPMYGYISNARIVKGVAVYTSNFVPPTAPVTAITNTSLLLNMTSAGVYDSASTNNLETVADAKILSTQTPYAGSYYSNYFDGTGDYLTAPSNAAFTFGTGAFTIEAWIYPTVYGPTTGNWIYSNISATSGNSEIGLLLLNAGTIRLSTWNTAIATSTLTAPLNVWSHVVGSFDGTTYRLFVNGVLSGTSTTVQTLSGTGGAYIGTAGVAGVSLFTGYLSNLRIVKGTAVYTGNFAVPTAPLTAIANTSLLTCQSNRFVDNSANAFAITKYDNASVQSFNPFQRNSAATLYFDGNGDYLTVPATAQFAFGTGDFTIEAWIYLTAYGSSVAGAQLFGTVNGSISGYSINVGENIDRFRIVSNATGSWADNLVVSVGGGPPLNAWTHMCVVRSGANLTIYKNGVSVATTASAATWNFSGTTGVIGRFSEGTTLKDFTGYINDLRITRGVARYTTTFVPPTTAFIAL